MWNKTDVWKWMNPSFTISLYFSGMAESDTWKEVYGSLRGKKSQERYIGFFFESWQYLNHKHMWNKMSPFYFPYEQH